MSALAQLQASDPSASVFVTANAGSGKTTTLVSRVARLLRRGVDPAAILCVTYTKAAAAEMQRRLFQELGTWSILSDDKLAAQIANLEGVSADDFGPDDLSRARALFARALETPGGLKIETIHAFCEKLLRRFPLEAGVSPRFQVLEDAAAEALSREARETVALAAMARPETDPLARAFAHFAIELAHMQFEEMFRTLEARRTDLTAYVADCAAGAKPTPAAICSVPEGLAPEILEAEFAATIDWGSWRNAQATLALGSSNDQTIAERMAQVSEDAAPFDAICRVFYKDSERSSPRNSMATKKIVQPVRGWLADEQARVIVAREPIVAARVARDSTHLLTLASAYSGVYETIKASSRALDFTDLIVKARDLLATREDAAWVLYKLDGGIDHVLLDEAQDTAPEQWEILRRLTEEFFAGASASRDPRALKRTLFVVGDEKQSIYSFQGAQPEQLNRETETYLELAREAGVSAQTVGLEMSWRSTPEVLAFVDAVCAPDDVARALDSAYEAPNKHVPMRNHAGGVDLWPEFKDDPPPDRDAWEPVDAAIGEGARKRLAMRIAAEIRAAVNRGDAVYDKQMKTWRGASWGDFLILVRRRDILFEEIIRALKQAGVPVAGADRLKLSEHIAFDDLRAIARFALYPRDDLTLAALLRSPFCDVDEQSLFDLAHDRKGSLFRALRTRASERPEWRAAMTLFDDVLSETRAPFELYNRLLGRLDADGHSMRSRLLSRLGREAEDAIDEFLNQVLAAEARGVHDLEGLAAELDASDVIVKRELEGERGEVRVMTAHGAKGLEAPIVFLPDTTVRAKPQGSPLFETADGGFLWAPRKDDDCLASQAARARRDLKTDQESLRLLYVAMTRARDRLVICGRTPATKPAEAGSWWTRLRDAFARPEIKDATRTVMLGDMSIERFGADPEMSMMRRPEHDHAAALPAWTQVRLTPERGARWASPSNIADQAKAPAPSPLAERSGLGRFRRGDLIHKLFEVLPDVAPEHRRAAAERLMAREPDLTPDQRSEMIAAAFGVLEDPRFAEVFGPGSRAEAALAGTAPDLPQGIAISGRLDRLVVAPDRVLVVDYKTNRPAPDAIGDADPAYVAQMAVYVAVLRALYPGRAVEAALIWTDGPRLMEVPQDVIEQALESLRRDS